MFTAGDANPNSFNWGPSREVLEACSRFRQGDIIPEASLAFSIFPDRPITTIAQNASAAPGGFLGVRVTSSFSMITSQTCDLRGARGKKYPFLSLAPVYDAATIFPKGNLGNIRRDRVGELVALDGPDWNASETAWVADLRFETTIEKGFLVLRQPMRGFAHEDGYLRCGRKIARVRSRSAIDDIILVHLLGPLEKLFLENVIEHADILDVLIKATPSLVDARAARIYVLLDEGKPTAELQQIFDDWHANVNPVLPLGFTFLGVEVRAARDFTWMDYRGAEIVDFSEISSGDA